MAFGGIRILLPGLLCLLMGLGIGIVSTHSGDTPGVLRVGVLEDSPPYDFYNSRNQLVGLNLDIIQEMARRRHQTVQVTTMPYNRVMMGLMFKHYDVVAAPQSVNPYRQTMVRFLTPYLVSDDVLVYRADSQPVGTLAETKRRGLRVAAFNGTSYPGFLRKQGLAANMVVFPTQREMFMAFLNGKVDVMLMDEPIARYYRDHEGFPFAWSARPVRLDKAMAFSVRKEDEQLARDLESTLTAMRQDGTLARIQRRWSLQPQELAAEPRIARRLSP